MQFLGARVLPCCNQAVLHCGQLADNEPGSGSGQSRRVRTLALPDADRLYLTEVHADVDGDAYFPEYDKTEWQEISREDFSAEGPNPYNYSFVVYDKKR